MQDSGDMNHRLLALTSVTQHTHRYLTEPLHQRTGSARLRARLTFLTSPANMEGMQPALVVA